MKEIVAVIAFIFVVCLIAWFFTLIILNLQQALRKCGDFTMKNPPPPPESTIGKGCRIPLRGIDWTEQPQACCSRKEEGDFSYLDTTLEDVKSSLKEKHPCFSDDYIDILADIMFPVFQKLDKRANN